MRTKDIWLDGCGPRPRIKQMFSENAIDGFNTFLWGVVGGVVGAFILQACIAWGSR